MKMAVSDKFKKFRDKNRKVVEAARKAENMMTGCPLPIGTIGVAVVANVEFTASKEKDDGTGGIPMVRVELEVESPEAYRGKKITGPGLMQMIKASAKQTEEDAYGRALDMLEAAGLPHELREEFEEEEEIVDWFEAEPRKVEFNVRKDDFAGNRSGKTVNITPYLSESNSTAEGPETEEEDNEDDDPDAEYVMYLNKKHRIEKKDGDQLTLVSPQGRVRTVPESKVQPIK